MGVDLIKALMLVFHFCLEENDCRQCPIRSFCGRKPCEW